MITQMLLQQTLLTTIIQREKLDADHLDAGFWLVIGGSLALTALAAGAGTAVGGVQRPARRSRPPSASR